MCYCDQTVCGCVCYCDHDVCVIVIALYVAGVLL